jgi:hypothetical protein
MPSFFLKMSVESADSVRSKFGQTSSELLYQPGALRSSDPLTKYERRGGNCSLNYAISKALIGGVNRQAINQLLVKGF